MKKSFFTSIVILNFFTILGCGNSMRSANKSTSNMAYSQSTELGKLEWNAPVGTDSADVEISYDLKIPFGRVYKTVSKTVEQIAPLLKKQLGQEAQSYLLGEVPVGTILDGNWKQITVVDVERTETVNSGYTVTVDAFQLPLWLSRETRQGPYVERSLDTKRQTQMVSSRTFGDDISFRWTPLNRSVTMEMCMNIPGATLTAPERSIHARARKKTWYGQFSVSSDFKIQPGQIQWDYGRGCFAAQYLNTSEGGVLNLTATEKPYIKSVNYTGLKIRIENWFLRLIDNILSIFNASIRKAVIKKVTNSVNTIADRDIESGQWFSKVYTDQVLNDLGKRVHDKIRNTVQRVGGFVSHENVRTLIKDNCRLMKFSKSSKWTEKHAQFCQDFSESIKIFIDPFAEDEVSRNEGCYDYLANIHGASRGSAKWWAKTCQFNVRFTVRMSQSAKDYLDEVHDLLMNQIDELRIPKDWQQTLSRYQVDENTLNQILEEIERRGIEELSSQDLEKNLPALIEQVRLKI